MPQPPPRPRSRAARSLCAAALVLALASCANLEFTRTSPEAGTFRSTGFALTILSVDLPKEALQIARENASDAGQPNMVVHEARVVPQLGYMDWLLEILGLRWAVVSGTWGFPPEPGASEPADEPAVEPDVAPAAEPVAQPPAAPTTAAQP